MTHDGYIRCSYEPHSEEGLKHTSFKALGVEDGFSHHFDNSTGIGRIVAGIGYLRRPNDDGSYSLLSDDDREGLESLVEVFITADGQISALVSIMCFDEDRRINFRILKENLIRNNEVVIK